MSLDQPSGLFDVRDVAWCRDCEGMRPGQWSGDLTKPSAIFVCDACQGQTGGAE
jgi:hypothetical protein